MRICSSILRIPVAAPLPVLRMPSLRIVNLDLSSEASGAWGGHCGAAGAACSGCDSGASGICKNQKYS